MSASASLPRQVDSVLLGRLGLLAALLLAWEWLGRADEAWLSRPGLVAARLLGWMGGELWPHLATTLAEIAGGLLLGVPLGALCGLVLGRRPVLAALLRPLVVAAYSVPLVTLAPLLILWFGLDMAPKVVLVAAVSYFLLFFTAFAGVQALDEDGVAGLVLMGATRGEVLRKLVLPASLAWLLSGLRVALPYALVAATVGELIAARRGVGALLSQAASQIDMTGLYAAILVLMALGALMAAGAARLEAHLMRWREAGR